MPKITDLTNNESNLCSGGLEENSQAKKTRKKNKKKLGIKVDGVYATNKLPECASSECNSSCGSCSSCEACTCGCDCECGCNCGW